jgi:hypothetical protein
VIVNAIGPADQTEWRPGARLVRSNGVVCDPDQEENIDPDWDPIGAFRQYRRRQASKEAP